MKLFSTQLSHIKRPLSLLCLVGLLVLSGCTSQVELFTAMNEADANEIMGVLLHAKIETHKIVAKNLVSITVADNDVSKALDILRQRGLPPEPHEGMGQVFHKDGMISSPLEEQARYVYALSQELEKTLTKIDGVLVARVHVVLPIQDVGSSTKSPSSASVFIKYQGNYNLELLKPQIQSLVANAIPELAENRISIILVAAHLLAPLSLSADTDTQGNQVASVPAQSSHWLRWSLIAGVMIIFLGILYGVWRRVRSADEGEQVF